MPFSADFDQAELSEHVCQELDLETSKNLRLCVNTMMGAEGCSPRSPHARCRCRRALTATSTVACGQSEQRHLLPDEGAAIMRKNAAACAASTIRGAAAL